jgi:FkbM family methyltransferase
MERGGKEDSRLLRAMLYDLYAFLFSRSYFYRLNRGLHHASLRGLGILNYKNDLASGERRFIGKALSLSETPTVLDVGANNGDFSSAVMNANKNARVFAFEPHPETYKRLSSRMFSAKNVLVTNAACGSIAGKFTLYDHARGGGTEHASLHRGVIERIHKDESIQHVVNVITLDQFAADKGINLIHLLKIDVEGNELEVLKGAASLLREGRIRAIQFEFNEMNIVSRVFFRDFCDAIPNYRFYRMLRNGLCELDPYSPLSCEVFAYQNIVALPKS